MLQLSQRPLMATDADARLFVGRVVELANLSRSVRLRFNTLVLGERGSGRTSLLHRLEHWLDEAGVAVRFADASGCSSLDDLLGALREAIHGGAQAASAAFSTLYDRAGGGITDIGWLRPLDGGQLVVLLDGIVDPDLVTALFGRYRDEVWDLPITWVVAGELNDRSRLMQPPADAFFDIEIVVPTLTDIEVYDVLLRRADAAGDEPDAATVRELASALGSTVGDATPRRVLAEARRMLVDGAADAALHVARISAAQHKAAAIGRAAAMLYTELLALGPVSASDPRLLDRMGWSRSRATQVLHELEEAGLVVASDETRSTPGRPRRVYRATGEVVEP
jgi:hypothetical protein